MYNLGKCESYGCEEEAIGCTDDGDYFCSDCLFEQSFETHWDEEPLEDDEDFPDSEVALLDTKLFDGDRDV